MREYADQGAQLVWGECYAVEREARQVAADYPNVAFLMGSSGGPEGENFGVFGTRLSDPDFEERMRDSLGATALGVLKARAMHRAEMKRERKRAKRRAT